MERILHQLIMVVYPIIYEGFIYPRWLFGISSIKSMCWGRSTPILSIEEGRGNKINPPQKKRRFYYKQVKEIPVIEGGAQTISQKNATGIEWQIIATYLSRWLAKWWVFCSFLESPPKNLFI